MGVALLLSLALPAFAEPLRLTMEEASRIALARSPRIAAALARVEGAREAAEVAAAPARPQARLSGYREQIRTVPGPPLTLGLFAGAFTGQNLLQTEAVEYGDTTAQLEVRQLLFDGGQVEARIAEARAAQGQAEAALVGAAQALQLDVRRAYLDVLQARSQERLVAQAEEVARQERERATARFEAGAAARADVVFAEVPVARAELDRVRVQQSVGASLAALNRLLGLPLDTPLALAEPGPAEPIPGTVAQAEAEARTARAEVRQAEAGVEAARRGREAADAGNDPQLYAVGSTNGVAYDNDWFPVDYGWRVALEAQWALLDGNRTVHEVRRADARIREAEAQLQDVREGVALEVRQAWLDVATLHRAFETAKVEVERAEEALAMATGRYETGVATFLEVSNAQVDLLSARTRQVQAWYDYLRARARLSYARGEAPAP